MKKDIILIGIQGSGKGTQARILEKEYGYQVFETGSILRALAKSETELGQKIAGILNRGDLVSNEIVMEMVRDFFESQEDLSTPIIFDGIPRFEEQRQSLETLLSEYDRSFTALHIEIPDEESFNRLETRAKIENRADDTPEAIKKRIQIFHDETEPLLEKWDEQDRLLSIDGQGEIEEITARLVEQIDVTNS